MMETQELAFAKQLCSEAGSILLQRMEQRQLGQIEQKASMTDLVTAVDREVDAYIVKRIQETFPAHTILTEEQGYFEAESSKYQWIIDPLDGTRNYIFRYPLFCVSIALAIDGKPEVGVIGVPYLRETYWAQRGRGAFMNGSQITVSEKAQFEGALLGTGFACIRDARKKNNLPIFQRIIRQTYDIRRSGSAAFDLCSVACGRLDGFWELGLSPWDVAAGSLLIEEAGGQISDFSGGDQFLFGRQMVATNGKIHTHLLHEIETAWAEQESQP